MEKTGIIVGIPTYNEEENVGFVVKQVDRGLRKHFPGKTSLIIGCDGKSTDRTKETFMETETFSEKKFVQTTERKSGKGNVFRLLFKLVRDLKPEATVVVDADLKSINPGWIRLLAGPVLRGYDHVTPVYVRERYDGTITNHIVYPIVYGLLGRNVRQPIAGDFAFSTRLAEYWLKQKWGREAGKYGIDIFMTTHAIFGGFRTCQASLSRKIHRSSAPRLSEMFLQVVKTLFDNVMNNSERWVNNPGFEEEKMFGVKTLPEPMKTKPDPENILNIAMTEYHKENVKNHLNMENFEKVNSMFFERNINIDPDLWSRIVYDLIYSYLSGNDKDEIVRSMRSLYFARVYTFFKEIPEYTTEEVESEIRKQAGCFRNNREYLINRLIK
jgi:glycosyltransferase involved in cell wall biosynthesis